MRYRYSNHIGKTSNCYSYTGPIDVIVIVA